MLEIAVLEIAVGHWPFSDQFQHLVGQIYYKFSMGHQSIAYKSLIFKKTADQFLTLISTTAIVCHSSSLKIFYK